MEKNSLSLLKNKKVRGDPQTEEEDLRLEFRTQNAAAEEGIAPEAYLCTSTMKGKESEKSYLIMRLGGKSLSAEFPLATITTCEPGRFTEDQRKLIVKAKNTPLSPESEYSYFDGEREIALDTLNAKRTEWDSTKSNRINVATKLVAHVKALGTLDIIHQDLKLDNIVIDKSGTVRLIDFGLAQELSPNTTINVAGSYISMGKTQLEFITSGKEKISTGATQKPDYDGTEVNPSSTGNEELMTKIKDIDRQCLAKVLSSLLVFSTRSGAQTKREKTLQDELLEIQNGTSAKSFDDIHALITAFENDKDESIVTKAEITLEKKPPEIGVRIHTDPSQTQRPTRTNNGYADPQAVNPKDFTP